MDTSPASTVSMHSGCRGWILNLQLCYSSVKTANGFIGIISLHAKIDLHVGELSC